MNDTMTLRFGLSRAIPDDAKAAWGARLIVRQDGDVDFVYDRQDSTGDETTITELHAWLNGGAMNEAKRRASDLLREWPKASGMSTRTERQFTLYEDGRGRIIGDTLASAGYLYVVAFLRRRSVYDVPARARYD